MKLWGDKFRKAFGEIGDLCSLVSSSLKVMALTATIAETFSLVIPSNYLCGNLF